MAARCRPHWPSAWTAFPAALPRRGSATRGVRLPQRGTSPRALAPPPAARRGWSPWGARCVRRWWTRHLPCSPRAGLCGRATAPTSTSGAASGTTRAACWRPSRNGAWVVRRGGACLDHEDPGRRALCGPTRPTPALHPTARRRYRQATGVRALRIGHTRSLGHYVEVRTDAATRLPGSEFFRCATLKDRVRFKVRGAARAAAMCVWGGRGKPRVAA